MSGCIIGKDYPKPIVDHDTVRQQNIKKMDAAYKAGEWSLTWSYGCVAPLGIIYGIVWWLCIPCCNLSNITSHLHVLFTKWNAKVFLWTNLLIVLSQFREEKITSAESYCHHLPVYEYEFCWLWDRFGANRGISWCLQLEDFLLHPDKCKGCADWHYMMHYRRFLISLMQ